MRLDKYPILLYSICMKQKNKTDYTRRINIIKGQLDGLLKMIEEDQYCMDVLNQSLSIQNSLKSLDALVYQQHLQTHVTEEFKTNKEKAVEELVKIFERVKN